MCDEPVYGHAPTRARGVPEARRTIDFEMHVIIIFQSYYDAYALLPSFAQEFRSNDFIEVAARRVESPNLVEKGAL